MFGQIHKEGIVAINTQHRIATPTCQVLCYQNMSKSIIGSALDEKGFVAELTIRNYTSFLEIDVDYRLI